MPFCWAEIFCLLSQICIKLVPLQVVKTIKKKFASHCLDIYIYYIPPPLTVHFPMTRNVRHQPILHTLYYTLHTEHAYCLSYRFLNNVVITTVIEMVEMIEILDGRLGKRSVERVRYVINKLLHLVIVKYGVISLVLCISTRLRLVTILSLLVKYLVIFHANPCNKSYIYYWTCIFVVYIVLTIKPSFINATYKVEVDADSTVHICSFW